MLWNLKYHLEDNFDAPVSAHSFTLRCLPRETNAQRVKSLSCSVTPLAETCRGMDSYGNPVLTGRIDPPHAQFGVKLAAIVQAEEVLEEELLSPHQLGRYRYGSALTAMGPTLAAFYEKLPAWRGENVSMRASALMEALSSAFAYVPGVTGFETTAEEALELGCGVCQDYAHILLSLLRKDGITARYVAGAIPGEGMTHAWVQVYEDGFWRGFDPTHNCETGDGYLSFGVGRDASDCPVNRGIFRGGAAQTQNVLVQMEAADLDIRRNMF